MTTDLEHLIGLARIARATFELVAVKNSFHNDLSGLCYDASSFLRRMAKAHGIETELGHGPGHWFVLLGDVVVDITSTQFGQPEKVAVLPLAEAAKRGIWWELYSRHSDPPPKPDRLGEMAEAMVGLVVGEVEW
jgi:hypothetical protein